MKLDILAFAAHPDDVELSCSGTIIKHVKAGHKAGIIDLTRGELGTRGTPEIRAQEAAAASKILGISVRENLDMGDGFFDHSERNKLAIITVLRKYQPAVVLANAVRDRHPDHGRAAGLVAEACFLSGLKGIDTRFEGKPQAAWRPRSVYHYIQDRQMVPDIIVDITDCMEERMKAILMFKSQFYDPGSTEPETAISSKQFLELLRSRSMEFGRLAGVEYGEGFTCERPPGVSDMMNLL